MSEDVRIGGSEKSGEDSSLPASTQCDCIKWERERRVGKCLKVTVFQSWQLIVKHEEVEKKIKIAQILSQMVAQG